MNQLRARGVAPALIRQHTLTDPTFHSQVQRDADALLSPSIQFPMRLRRWLKTALK